MNVASRKPPGTVRTIELEHTPCTTIRANGILHCLIFLHRGLCKLLPKHQHIGDRRLDSCEQSRHRLLIERLGFNSLLLEPCLHLRDTVRVLKAGQSFQPVRQFFLGSHVDLDGVLHQGHIQTYSTIIDFLVEHIFIPYRLRHRIFGETFLYCHLHFHVATVVRLEEFPLRSRGFVERRR